MRRAPSAVDERDGAALIPLHTQRAILHRALARANLFAADARGGRFALGERKGARAVAGDRRHPDERVRRLDEIVPRIVLRRLDAHVHPLARHALDGERSAVRPPSSATSVPIGIGCVAAGARAYAHVVAHDLHVHLRHAAARTRSGIADDHRCLPRIRRRSCGNRIVSDEIEERVLAQPRRLRLDILEPRRHRARDGIHGAAAQRVVRLALEQRASRRLA